MTDTRRLDEVVCRLAAQLQARRVGGGYWEGHLASSPLATATAVVALDVSARGGYCGSGRLDECARAGVRWLVAHQNEDGGWGDTTRSRSNLSTTAVVWAALSAVGDDTPASGASVAHATEWLRAEAGDVAPSVLQSAIIRRYGSDRTFSVPILVLLALTGRLGADERSAWRSVPQLPFELAALPHGWFQHLRLPVVSYALPALVAMGQVRHHAAPSRNPVTRVLRTALSDRTHRVLRDMQPQSGGYLEAVPLTSFVVMSLAGAGRANSPVVDDGLRFLLASMRTDGSWPIDTNLATWVTTLAIDALAQASALGRDDRRQLAEWLLAQQSTTEHPFTHAAPGAWAWTPLSGGVPDADDTAGALLALHRLAEGEAALSAAAAGVEWLLDVQNQDGGIPTFCRGWGTLPFDSSTPEITAHALQAWSAWRPCMSAPLHRRMVRGAARAIRFLCRVQRHDGSWTPLWFGNERAPDEQNPTYGTSRVLLGLSTAVTGAQAAAAESRDRGLSWLLQAQNADGGWGGARSVPSSIEETGVALSALASSVDSGQGDAVRRAVARGCEWLIAATASRFDAAPIGLYFARLWYFEELYPLVFALHGLAAARRALGMPAGSGRSGGTSTAGGGSDAIG